MPGRARLGWGEMLWNGCMALCRACSGQLELLLSGVRR